MPPFQRLDNLIVKPIGTGTKHKRAPGQHRHRATYQLPQVGRIAETCASIGMMMLGLRLHGLYGESKYFDTIETILYNNFLGALNEEQDAIFYYNQIRAMKSSLPAEDLTHPGGSLFRRVKLPDIHRVACCFTNAWRFFAQLPEYIFSTDGRSVAVNLYTSASASINLDGGRSVDVDAETAYPFDERITVNVSAPVTLRLRIPAWCEGASVRHGDATHHAAGGEYYEVQATPELAVELHLPMPVRMMSSTSRIADNMGQVAFARGPVIYCYEQTMGSRPDIEKLKVVTEQPGVARDIDGIPLIEVTLVESREPETAYFEVGRASQGNSFDALLIPFNMRANRESQTEWLTWIPGTYHAVRG